MKENHPLTELIPEIADQDELVIDIAQNTMERKVITYEGKILEGRVRYRAALEAGLLSPKSKDWVLLNSSEKDPLEWALRMHTNSHVLTELDLIKLVANVLPYFHELSGATHTRLNRVTGLSIRKIRVIDWLQEMGALQPVLDGEKDLLEAGRAAGVVSEKRHVALGTSYGHGDKFDEATQPLKRYLASWKRKGYQFRHVNPKEATRRLSIIRGLVEELQAAIPDLEKRSVTATLTAPPERKRK